jgi:hypothetical protein
MTCILYTEVVQSYRTNKLEGNMSKIKLHRTTLPDVINKLRIDESRLINCCLLGADQGILFKDELYYPVDVYRYAKLGNITMTAALTELVEICEYHRSNCLQIPVKLANGNTPTLYTSLIYNYIVDTACKTIGINWNPKFVPYISGYMKPGEFITVESVMDSVSSNRRYSMYVLLTQYLWELDKYPDFKISEIMLRHGLGLKDTEYKEFKELIRSIVKPTLVEVYNKLGRRLQCKVRRGYAVFSELHPTIEELI